MITALVAALSLAAPLTLDVPYLPQTDALCGGAAAAMVFRYWGDTHANVREFAPLVDRRAGGIADDVLVDEIARRGWRTDQFQGSMAALHDRLNKREPMIVLLASRSNRYHYVVVVGATLDRIVIHDPSWGPARAVREDDFEARWRAAEFWSLVILPPAAADATVRLKPDTTFSTARPEPVVAGPARPEPVEGRAARSDVASGFSRTLDDRCDALLDRAITDVQQRGLAEADKLFDDVRARCPQSAGPLRELAGVRFAQRRWGDATAWARAALGRDPHDAYALDVLGSSLFMQNDAIGALRAWNQIGKPRIDRVRIEGLHHARYQAIAAALELEPGTLLTAEVFARATRRLNELPDRSTARLAARPDSDGFAVVDVVIAEREAIPRHVTDWTALGLSAAVDREATMALPGGAGEGEVWSASWRWWHHRPRVAVAFAAPRVGGLPGIWRVDASWDAQTYLPGDARALARESRTHAGLAVSDWLTDSVRYSASGGLDSWNGKRRAGSIGASVERRLFKDHVALSANAETWIAMTADRGFGSVGASAQWLSSAAPGGWGFAADAGVERVSDAAPLGLWPGAGDGHARAELLRAHPLVEDGAIDVSRPSGFGRTLNYANAETKRWFDRSFPVRFGIAAFVDAARTSRTITTGAGPLQIDVGGGLRVRVPGVNRVLRVDVAHGLRDGANALTVGWIY